MKTKDFTTAQVIELYNSTNEKIEKITNSERTIDNIFKEIDQIEDLRPNYQLQMDCTIENLVANVDTLSQEWTNYIEIQIVNEIIDKAIDKRRAEQDDLANSQIRDFKIKYDNQKMGNMFAVTAMLIERKNNPTITIIEEMYDEMVEDVWSEFIEEINSINELVKYTPFKDRESMFINVTEWVETFYEYQRKIYDFFDEFKGGDDIKNIIIDRIDVVDWGENIYNNRDVVNSIIQAEIDWGI